MPAPSSLNWDNYEACSPLPPSIPQWDPAPVPTEVTDNTPLSISFRSLTDLPDKLFTLKSLSQGPLVGEPKLRLHVTNMAIQYV